MTGNELFAIQICMCLSFLRDAPKLSLETKRALSRFTLAPHGTIMGTKTLSSSEQQKHSWLELQAPLEQLV